MKLKSPIILLRATHVEVTIGGACGKVYKAAGNAITGPTGVKLKFGSALFTAITAAIAAEITRLETLKLPEGFPESPPAARLEVVKRRHGEQAVTYTAVQNVMTGALVWEAEGTPWSCSVASEAYFCN